KGLTWASVIVSAAAVECLCAHGGDRFVAYVSGYTCESETGETGSWDAKPFPGTLFLKHYLVSLGGRLVMTAGNDTWFSDDVGATWVQGGGLTEGMSGSPPDNNITHNGLRLIIGTDDSVEISDDGAQ